MTTKSIGFYYFVCGKLLGDGCITKQERRKPRFQFMHRTEDFGWANHCYEQLKDHIPLNPPTYRKVIDARLRKGYSESFIVQSRTHEVITQLYRQWYPTGKKKLPFNFIETYLDKRALAWWYQDDGHLKTTNGIITKIILSTDSFSPEENSWLIQLLCEKFQLRFQIDGQNRLILYDQFQIIYFLHLVSPWLHESMNRKSLPEQPLRSVAKRTTVYLPTKFTLQKPTFEINEKLNFLGSLFNDNTEVVRPNDIFATFLPLLDRNEELKSYQIIIKDNHRNTLAEIRRQTGLAISLLTEYCFRLN